MFTTLQTSLVVWNNSFELTKVRSDSDEQLSCNKWSSKQGVGRGGAIYILNIK